MTATEVVEKITALRRITKETGCITRRAQSELLASLPDALLIEVAPLLKTAFQQTERTDRNEHTDSRTK
jgi:hypothetical protein